MTDSTPSRAGVTQPGSGPQPEERHVALAKELLEYVTCAGLPAVERGRCAAWLARFEAEVRGEEREEIERLAKPYEEMTANETVAALRPYWRDAAETFWRMKRAPCEPTCTCDGDPIFVLAVLLKRYAAALRAGGSRSEEGGE